MAAASGLRYQWGPHLNRPLTILDTFGNGCAFLDFDADGRLDILLVGSPRCGLFLNDGQGGFRDVTSAVGLDRFTGKTTGCAVGDYDGDGFPDLLLTGYRRLLLLRNQGGQALRNVTVPAGLREDNYQNWGSSAGFMDLDQDGDLDLVVLNYSVFDESSPQLCEPVPGVLSGCPPQTYEAEFGRLFRNEGGLYSDVTASSGFADTHGRGLVVGFCDYDDDGRIDFYVGNDGTPAELMHNLGDMQFRNEGETTGTAFGSIPGQAIASMGIDWADYDRDGLMDFAASAFENEAYPLFRNEGNGFFEFVSDRVRLTGPTFSLLGFGANFIDVDNDGYPDLFYANGHVYDAVDQFDTGATFRQRMQLFHNREGLLFEDLAPRLGGAWSQPILGRGSATGDYDDDGRMDLLVVDYEGAPLLFHNETETDNHWIKIAARGSGQNRHGYGLRVTARAGTQVWVGEISPASSYLSSKDPRVHFGLGQVEVLDTLEVRWATGRTQTLRDVRADQILTVEEGNAS